MSEPHTPHRESPSPADAPKRRSFVPTVAGRLTLRGITYLPPAVPESRGVGFLRVSMLCGDEPLSLVLPPVAFESFIRFRTEVFASVGRWLTVEDPFAATWQEIVAAACAAPETDPSAGEADADAARS